MPVVFLDGEDTLKIPPPSADAWEQVAESEADGVEDSPILPHFEAEVVLPHDSRGPVDFEIPGQEGRPHVARPKRSELAQDPDEPR